MIGTSFFAQLTPSPLGRIRDNYRSVKRVQLPAKLSFLEHCGVCSEWVEPLRALVEGSQDERLMTAAVFLAVFEGEYFRGREGIIAWLARSPSKIPGSYKAAAKELAAKLIEEEMADTKKVGEEGGPSIQFLSYDDCTRFLAV